MFFQAFASSLKIQQSPTSRVTHPAFVPVTPIDGIKTSFQASRQRRHTSKPPAIATHKRSGPHHFLIRADMQENVDLSVDRWVIAGENLLRERQAQQKTNSRNRTDSPIRDNNSIENPHGDLDPNHDSSRHVEPPESSFYSSPGNPWGDYVDSLENLIVAPPEPSAADPVPVDEFGFPDDVADPFFSNRTGGNHISQHGFQHGSVPLRFPPSLPETMERCVLMAMRATKRALIINHNDSIPDPEDGSRQVETTSSPHSSNCLRIDLPMGRTKKYWFSTAPLQFSQQESLVLASHYLQLFREAKVRLVMGCQNNINDMLSLSCLHNVHLIDENPSNPISWLPIGNVKKQKKHSFTLRQIKGKSDICAWLANENDNQTVAAAHNNGLDDVLIIAGTSTHQMELIHSLINNYRQGIIKFKTHTCIILFNCFLDVHDYGSALENHFSNGDAFWKSFSPAFSFHRVSFPSKSYTALAPGIIVKLDPTYKWSVMLEIQPLRFIWLMDTDSIPCRENWNHWTGNLEKYLRDNVWYIKNMGNWRVAGYWPFMRVACPYVFPLSDLDYARIVKKTNRFHTRLWEVLSFD